MSDLTAAVIGTLDTKRAEFDFLSAELRRCGLATLMVDISCLEVIEGSQTDYTCVEVARRAGRDFGKVAELGKWDAGRIMVTGATAILEDLWAADEIDGLIALGGGNGTLMACEIMRVFPIGFPKLVVSVVPATNPREDAGTSDIILMNSVTDLSLNRLTKQIMSNAAAAMAGMLRQGRPVAGDEGTLQIGASMLGLTQGCVLGAKAVLETGKQELLVFHSNGIGGVALEDLITRGAVDAVLDLTTNEVANNMLGGAFDAGPDRLEAAVAQGIPQVIAPGAVDFVNFWGKSVPSSFRDRQFIFYTAQNTLMRTTTEENRRVGHLFAEKLNRSKNKVRVLVPVQGFSGNDVAGGAQGVTMEGKAAGPWHSPEADKAFVDGLKSVADPAVIDIREIDAHINDPAFGEAVVEAYDAQITEVQGRLR
jgi:uncharacterized protein (UPF0261 family)